MLYEHPTDAEGEASMFPAWAGAVSAARARILMEMGQRAAAEEELTRAFTFNTAREEALDVFMELHGSEDVAQILAGMREVLGEGEETLAYLARFADSYGWLALGAAARAELSRMTGHVVPTPEIYERMRVLAPKELGEHVVGTLVEYVREMPEILLRLERERRAESLHLYHRLRSLLPDAMLAFWRHYDEPDAVALPEAMDGYESVRAAFIHHADAEQSARFLRVAAGYGRDVLRAAAEDFADAQRWEGAFLGWSLLSAVEGESPDSCYGMALAALYLGARTEAQECLTRACTLDPSHRKAMELLELIK